MIPGARLRIFGWREYALSFSDHDHKKARNIVGAMGCILLALVLGFTAYGLSIYFYIYAQRDLGAATTSTYYAILPFIGALLSLLIFGEWPSMILIIAVVVIAIGTYFSSTSDS